MNYTNIEWCEIQDYMESLVYEFLDFYEVFDKLIPEYTWVSIDTYTELEVGNRVLEWLKNAWKLLIQSRIVIYCNEAQYFQASLCCITLFCLYAEYSGLGIVSNEDFLDMQSNILPK